jgi:hypothetical protein
MNGRGPALAFEPSRLPLDEELRRFTWRGRPTAVGETAVPLGDGRTLRVPTFVNEFWTSRQRAAHSLHEISYRACFKPQLPRFFIERLTAPGDAVYDPFAGRGTTPLEAALLGRVPFACDINPLSRLLLEPRLDPPTLTEAAEALARIGAGGGEPGPGELLVFYHPDTLRQIAALRAHLIARDRSSDLTRAERWIRMVAINRLTGHSPGFFSVYTLPPNQAVSVQSQRRINARRAQTPPRRDVPGLILAKSRSLVQDCDEATRRTLAGVWPAHRLLTGSAAATPGIETGSVDLVVTSPPFLDVVDYATDNWLRCWFAGIDAGAIEVSVIRRLDRWRELMTAVFAELRRVLRPGGHVAFEVGEVRGGAVRLEEAVIASAAAAGLDPVLVLINDQRFTKTANCWGVANNRRGTNTNRVVVLRH